MTDLRQAAMQALEALEIIDRAMPFPVGKQIITTLREALAQPEQQAEQCVGKDPRCPCNDGDACHYKDCGGTKALPVPAAQPEQEPVAWNVIDPAGNILASEKNAIRGWARVNGYKPTVEGLLGLHELGWRVLPTSPTAAQPEPTPWREMVVATLVREGVNKHKARELADHFAAQPEQKPVAWGVFEGNLHDMFFTQEEAQEMAKLKGSHAEARPLYTALPAQRQWVDLTDAERDEICLGDESIARSIEAKLRDKNGGNHES